MAVLGRLLLSSAERLDLPDLLSIDSYSAGDFKFFMETLVGTDKPFVLEGFDVINPAAAIGTSNISITVADSAMYYPGSEAGSFFYGLDASNSLAQPLVPTLRPNATNFVYLTLSTITTSNDNRAFWDPDLNGGIGGEFNQNVDTETALIAQVNVSVASFPPNTVPICKVVMGPAVITSIEDCRDLLFRLGSGGTNPNIYNRYNFRALPTNLYEREEPSPIMTSAFSPNGFQGADKNFKTWKEWMDVVMTKLAELGGSTFWYEDVSTFNLINLFSDALASTMKSKGVWINDNSTEGLLTWTEDIILKNLDDPRDIILRSGNKTLANEQVMWLGLLRGRPINGSGTQVEFNTGTNYINGPVGAFANLAQGDWIKKFNEGDASYLRVEQFYASTNLGGGVTSAALAQSIKLSANYPGLTETQTAVYSKGVYTSSDVQVTDRGDATEIAAGGDFHWLALRSDLIMNIGSVATTNLSGNIVNSNGSTAQFATTAHGLNDGDFVTITGSVNGYNGTYAVEVMDANNFFFDTAVTTNETGVSAHYALVTTTTRSTADGLQLENADNNFQTGYTIKISGTTNYNGVYTISSRSATQFQIPVASAFATETTGQSTLIQIDCRSETGINKVVRGETVGIGDSVSKAIFTFIGMQGITQTTPPYYYPPGFNAIYDYHNFNSSISDNLTQRISKLTGMMADRVQDRDMEIIGTVTIRNTTSGGNQVLTASGTVTIEKPGSLSQVVTLSSTLPVDSAAVVTIDRNGSGALTTTIESLGTAYLLGENSIILFYRLSGNTVYAWDGQPIPANGTYTVNNYETGQNKNIVIDNPGRLGFNTSSGLVTFLDTTADINIIVPGSNVTNFIDVSVINGLGTCIIADNHSAWVRIDRVTSKTFNVIQTSDVPDSNANGALYITTTASVPIDQDVIVVLTRKGNDLLQAHLGIPPSTNVYDESITIVSGAPANPYELTGPIVTTTDITLPPDSRDVGAQKAYVVGSGMLEIFLNGQYLNLGGDWAEVGSAGSTSIQIEILQELEVGDLLTFRIDTEGGVFFATGSGSGGDLQSAYDNGNLITVVPGTPVTITAASGKALQINGDLGVTGVIDPTGLVFDPQGSLPLQTSDYGLWIDTAGDLLQQRGLSLPQVNITQSILNSAAFTSPSLVNSIPTFNNTTGKLQNTGVTIDANNHLYFNTDAVANIGVDGRTTNNAGGFRPKNIFAAGLIAAGNLYGNNAPYGLNGPTSIVGGVFAAGNGGALNNSSISISGASPIFNGFQQVFFAASKDNASANVPGFFNNDNTADYDYYYSLAHRSANREDVLKFAYSGSISLLKTTGAHLLVNTDKAGDIGSPDDGATLKRFNNMYLGGFEDLGQISTPTTPGSGRNRLYFKSDDNLYTKNSSGVETQVAAASSSSPSWSKHTVTYTNLATAAMTNSVTLYTASPKEFINGVIIKHSTVFNGGSIGSYTVSIGQAGFDTQYASAFDVFQMPADDRFQSTTGQQVTSFSGSTAVTITATSTVDNLDAATQGSVDVWILSSILP